MTMVRTCSRCGETWTGGHICGLTYGTAAKQVVVEKAQQASIRRLEKRVAELKSALEECCRISGADLSDGFPTWPALPEFAIQCVQQLRDDYEEDA